MFAVSNTLALIVPQSLICVQVRTDISGTICSFSECAMQATLIGTQVLVKVYTK
jgi:hypothetical protein